MNVFVKIAIMKKCIMNNAKNYQKLKKTSMIIENFPNPVRTFHNKPYHL